LLTEIGWGGHVERGEEFDKSQKNLPKKKTGGISICAGLNKGVHRERNHGKQEGEKTRLPPGFEERRHCKRIAILGNSKRKTYD